MCGFVNMHLHLSLIFSLTYPNVSTLIALPQHPFNQKSHSCQNLLPVRRRVSYKREGKLVIKSQHAIMSFLGPSDKTLVFVPFR